MDNKDFMPWFLKQIYSPSREEKQKQIINDYVNELINTDEFMKRMKELNNYYDRTNNN